MRHILNQPDKPTQNAHIGEIDLNQYKNILAWIDRMKRIPGFIAMPGIPALA